METIEISTTVSPSLHPDILKLHEEACLGSEMYDTIVDEKGLARRMPTGSRSLDNTPGVNAYRDAREALEAIYQWHVAVEDAEKAFIDTVGSRQTKLVGRDNAGLFAREARQHIVNLAQNEQELMDTAEAGTKRAFAVSTRAAGTVSRAIESLSKQLDEMTEDPERIKPVGIALATEIRAHVKSLSKADRTQFVASAITNRDVKTVAALLRAPAYLSGLTPDEVDHARVAATKSWAQWQFGQFEALQKINTRLEGAHESISERLAKLKKTMATPIESRNKRNNAYAKLANGGR
jgi:hypothetical protein